MRALSPQDQWKKQRSELILAKSEGLMAVATGVPLEDCCWRGCAGLPRRPDDDAHNDQPSLLTVSVIAWAAMQHQCGTLRIQENSVRCATRRCDIAAGKNDGGTMVAKGDARNRGSASGSAKELVTPSTSCDTKKRRRSLATFISCCWRRGTHRTTPKPTATSNVPSVSCNRRRRTVVKFTSPALCRTHVSTTACP